jgi:hypothetical protein
MKDGPYRSTACYPWSLSTSRWAFRRVVWVRVHISREAVRVEPRGRHARMAPSLVVPMQLVVGVERGFGRIWIRTSESSDDALGLFTTRWRITAALRAIGVPDGLTSDGRDRGWSRPGTVLGALALLALFFLPDTRNGGWWDLLGPAIVLALAAWVAIMAPRGPYAGRPLALTKAGWVESL